LPSLSIQVEGTKSDGTIVARPYTPTSLSEQKGSFELIIKSYPEGVVSAYLDKLKVGDVIKIKGPFPKFKYESNMKRTIGMVITSNDYIYL
jgi:cytochrome-b5 reductase